MFFNDSKTHIWPLITEKNGENDFLTFQKIVFSIFLKSQKIVFPIFFGNQGSNMRFTIIKKHNLGHHIEKNWKLKKKSLKICHPRGSDQHPRINRLGGEIEKIALVKEKVITIRTSRHKFQVAGMSGMVCRGYGFEKGGLDLLIGGNL